MRKIEPPEGMSFEHSAKINYKNFMFVCFTCCSLSGCSHTLASQFHHDSVVISVGQN